MVKIVTYRGYKTVVVYDEETGYGAGATPATAIKGKLTTITTNRSNNLIRTLGLGEGRNETFVGFGNFSGTWSAEYEVAAFDFLQFGIGAMGGTGETATPYYLEEKDFMDYTATAANGLKSFGLIINGLDVTGGTHDKEELSGCIINTMGFTLSLGETLKCSVEGFYKTVTSSTVITAFTPDTTKPWIFAQGVFNWNGSPMGRVTSAAININNNFDADVGRELGSRYTEAAEPGLRKYDFVLTMKMTSDDAVDIRTAFYGASGANDPDDGVESAEPDLFAAILSLSEGSAAGTRNAQILLSDCAINDISKPINIGDNIVEITVNGTAKKGTTETTNRPFKWYTTT